MLNYFLQHLVGPKMGALKVKDFSEFDFKPQQLVSDICTIYLNLGYVTEQPGSNNCSGKEGPLFVQMGHTVGVAEERLCRDLVRGTAD